MRRFSTALVMALLAGCWTPVSCTPCPDKTEVERDWLLTSNCLPDAGVLLHVTNLAVNDRNDCQSGCFSTAHAHVEGTGGGIFVTGDYQSRCGDDPGTVQVAILPPGDAGSSSCEFALDRVGQDVACGNGCTARLSNP